MAVSAPQKFGQELADLHRRLKSVERSSQMAHRSIEGGAVKVYAADGTYRGAIGVQPDGGTAVTTANDPTPPEPSAPILAPEPGGLSVEWDGAFVSRSRPSDFYRLEVHASATADFTPGPATLRSAVSGASTVFIALPPDPYFVVFVAVTTGGSRSAPSGVAVETPAVAGGTDEDAREMAAVALETANGKNAVTYAVTDPEGDGSTAGDLWFRRTSSGVVVGTWEWAGSSWEPRKFGDATLESITAGKITTGELAAGQRIIAGPALGTHAEMSSTGFRVYSEDPTDGIPNEVIRLGTDSNDFFAISDGSDNLLASIDETGRASLQDLVVTKDPTVAGRKLLAYWIDRLPRGVIAQAEATPDRAGIIAETAIMTVTFVPAANRHLRITVSQIRQANAVPSGGGYFQVRDQTAAAYGRQLGSATIMAGGDKLGSTFTEGGGFVCDLPDGLSSEVHTAHLTVSAINGGVHVQYGTYPFRMVVEDLGPSRAGTGQTLATPQPTPSVPQTHVWEQVASWSAAYRGNGTAMSNAGGSLYQGSDPSGYNGNQKSLVGFPDVTGVLAGASVGRVEVYLYANHWYQNAGGTAVIGAHGMAGQPASYTGPIAENLVQSGGWPKPGGRWVEMPAGWGDAFRSGAYRGLVLGPGPSTSNAYYGRFNGHALAEPPRLRIVYTK